MSLTMVMVHLIGCHYGTWHSGNGKTTEGALSLYTLATEGLYDSDDYTVEAYGQGGHSNQTYYFTNPPKIFDTTFTTTDFNTTGTSFIEGRNGVEQQT